MSNQSPQDRFDEELNNAIRILSIEIIARMAVTDKVPERLYIYENNLAKAIKQLFLDRVIGEDLEEGTYSIDPIIRMKQQEVRAVNRKLAEMRTLLTTDTDIS